MAVNRFYSSTAVAAQLIAPMSSGDLTFTVNSVTGWPTSYPYTLVIDAGTNTQEIVSAISASSTVITCQRGQDGSSAVGHSNGATVTHDVSARDYAEPQLHMSLPNGVHGVTGNVVGTTDTQTLTNKTLTGPTLASPTVSGTINFGSAGLTLPSTSDTLVGRATTDTLTNKTLTSPVINGGVLDATSAIDGITGTQIAADHAQTATNTTNIATNTATLGKIGAPISGAPGGSTNSTGTIITTPTLGVGTWVVNASFSSNASTAGTAVVTASVASGSATLVGCTQASAAMSSAVTLGSLPLTFTVVVTVAATVKFVATLVAASIQAGPVSGYTAVQVA